MEDLEMSVTVEGTPDAVQHDKQRNLVRRLQPEGSERHLAAEIPKSNCWYISENEATFNHHLRAMFTVLLTFTVITVLMTEHFFKGIFPSYGYNSYWFGRLQLQQTGFLFVFKLAVVLTAGVLMKKIQTKMTDASRRKGKEMHTFSVVLQV